jgi:hypothetical protein
MPILKMSGCDGVQKRQEAALDGQQPVIARDA